jgi:poly-gamma-glutamate capsule biosynthesis protein CapA/YwtB (metallophosphatase superfamily)
MHEKLSVILGGDVMLGRLVRETIATKGDDYPLGNIKPILNKGDITIVNLECAITDHTEHWSGRPKVFYFGAPPIAAKIIADCGVDLVNLANNHILDFDVQGLYDTLNFLKKSHINFVGAGINKEHAQNHVIFTAKNITFGMVAFCDHQEDFAARYNVPGIAYLNLDDQTEARNTIRRSLDNMLKDQVEWPILSLHWGPNMVHRPSSSFIRFAHLAIDMGYKIIFGHSAHVFQGIEIYKGFPIFYATGDVVDDYYVDSKFKNDHQLLFEIEIERLKITRVFLYPIFISFCKAQPANKKQFEFIAKRAETLCREFNTCVESFDAEKLVINLC